MRQGERMRMLNKHMKIVLTTRLGTDKLLVAKTVNTLEPRVGSRMLPEEVQKFINDGFTVEIKRETH